MAGLPASHNSRMKAIGLTQSKTRRASSSLPSRTPLAINSVWYYSGIANTEDMTENERLRLSAATSSRPLAIIVKFGQGLVRIQLPG